MTARAPSISIDTLARGDLAAAHALTQDLRWPHRLEDWQAMLALGQGLAVRDDREALIGTGVIWSWGERVATVGLILVHPEHQGHGIGRRLVERLLAAAGDRTVRRNATEAGLKLYEQAGFARSGLVHQWQRHRLILHR